MFCITLLITWCIVVGAQYEGDPCVENGVSGICINMRKCVKATEDLVLRRKHPQICGFDKFDSIVCCIDNVSTSTQPLTPITTTTIRPMPVVTTEKSPEILDSDNPTEDSIESDCPPIDANLTSPKTGQKAWDKCLEYQEQLVYPCERTNALMNEVMERKTKCNMNADELIVGGQNASKNEFPHMALLGFGNEAFVIWSCGGTLISENFILTAGHCIGHRDAGRVTYAYLGALARNEVTDSSNRYEIKTIHKHPEYESPSTYHDIALLELDRRVLLDALTKPACLHTGDPIGDEQGWATGWGFTQDGGWSAETLQKVQLNKFSTFDCLIHYAPFREGTRGFDKDTQICYGHKSQAKDTCRGDSGGPLQIKHKKINCMWLVLGVTSFGKKCGSIGEPGIYTKVSHYVPWIESIVWP